MASNPLSLLQKWENFLTVDFIGIGSFGIIRKVQRTMNGLVCAIGGAFMFPGSPLFLADIRAQGTQRCEDKQAK